MTTLLNLNWKHHGKTNFGAQDSQVYAATEGDNLYILTLPPGQEEVKNYSAEDFQNHTPPEDFPILQIFTPEGEKEVITDTHFITDEESGDTQKRTVFLIETRPTYYELSDTLENAAKRAIALLQE